MLNKTLYNIFIFLFSLSFPLIAGAQTSFDVYVYNIIVPLRDIIPLLVGVAIAVFIWGVVRYMASSEDPQKKEGGRRILIIGIIGIFVLVSIWGIISILLVFFFGGDPGFSPFYFEPPNVKSDPGNLIPDRQSRVTEVCVAGSPGCLPNLLDNP